MKSVTWMHSTLKSHLGIKKGFAEKVKGLLPINIFLYLILPKISLNKKDTVIIPLEYQGSTITVVLWPHWPV